MEGDFFNLYTNQVNLALEIGHNSVADWGIRIYDRSDTSIRNSKLAVSVEGCDRKEVFAQAYFRLTEYLSETRGGY